MVHTLFIHLYTYLSNTRTLSLHFHCTLYTCTSKTVHCYIPVHTIVYLYIVIPYLLVIFNSSFYYLCFCSVAVILLHCSSFYHENKFLVCVNIPGNKAHSDSVSHDLSEIILICRFSAQETFLTNNIIEKNDSVMNGKCKITAFIWKPFHCNIINVLTATYDQINAFVLN